MYLLLKYPVGVMVEAIILARGKNRMRVAAAGFPDVVELKRSGAQWFTASHQPVEFEFLMSDAGSEGAPISELSRSVRALGAAPSR